MHTRRKNTVLGELTDYGVLCKGSGSRSMREHEAANAVSLLPLSTASQAEEFASQLHFLIHVYFLIHGNIARHVPIAFKERKDSDICGLSQSVMICDRGWVKVDLITLAICR
jgi:hypothetical protein